jgi:hypothetical protein
MTSGVILDWHEDHRISQWQDTDFSPVADNHRLFFSRGFGKRKMRRHGAGARPILPDGPKACTHHEDDEINLSG